MTTTKHIVSFSGGMGSFAEAKSCVDKYGKENVILLFCDTKSEDPDLYRFLEETKAFLDCEYVYLADGRALWELFDDMRFVANSRVDACSKYLKRKLLNGWILKTFGIKQKVYQFDEKGEPVLTKTGKHKYQTKWLPDPEKPVEVHLGIDFSEHHRLTRVQEYMNPWVYRSILVEDGRIVNKDFSEQFGIKRPYLYTISFPHNNCSGFCVKAGLGQFKMLYEKLPERYAFHEQKEQELKEKHGTKPFLKKTTKGVVRYITMKEYREEFLDVNGAEEDKFDIGGCACALPMGGD